MTISEDQWPPTDCPSLAWPDLENQSARLSWYGAVISAYQKLWEGHSSEPKILPVSDDALSQLEHRLGCALPPFLTTYHKKYGVLSLAERLCSVEGGWSPIEPLLQAYPGITEMASEDECGEDLLILAEKLVAFGDYLGNGNLFCFHKDSGVVYYFDHDDGLSLTIFFPNVETYLDALMIRTLTEIYDADSEGEALLIQRFGQPMVRKWLY
ncbi:MAG: SMI1/KNR4 family protein [Methylophilaceae bacterium]